VKATLPTWWMLVKETFGRWLEDDIATYAASLAYYTAFSLAPTLIIAVALAGSIFGEEAATGQIRVQLQSMLGDAGATVIEDMMKNASRPGSGVVPTILGGVVLLLGATGVFAALQTCLNRIWRAPPPTGNAVLGFLRTRFLSLAMVLGVGFLLLVSLVVSAVIGAFGALLGEVPAMWQVVNFLISFAYVTALFGMIYKWLPDVRVAWADVWLGAAVTALLFNLGKLVIGLYLGRSSIASSYGATGSLAVLLIWLDYSAMVLFLGAEFTYVYALRRGSRAGLPERAWPAQPPRSSA
jgi:membrane protein